MNLSSRIGDFLFENMGKVIVVLLVLCVLGIYAGDRAIGKKCDTLMRLAETRRDSADAIVACEKMHSDFGRNIAIGAAAGAVAGSAASRR